MRHRATYERFNAFFGGAAHLHTVLSNHPDHHESDLKTTQLVRKFVRAGLAGADGPMRYMMFNEHPSDPSRPRRLGRFSLRARKLLKQQRLHQYLGVKLFYGLEVSILPGGTTDLVPRLSRPGTVIIASRHALPAQIEHEPASIEALFRAVCDDPDVAVLGHPPRYIEDLAEVDWARIFAYARRTGTAVEINLNVFPDDDANAMQTEFWKRWLEQLADSGVRVFLGVDLHGYRQQDAFIRQWKQLETHPEKRLPRLIVALDAAGIGPEQVVTSTLGRLTDWLSVDKAARSKL